MKKISLAFIIVILIMVLIPSKCFAKSVQEVTKPLVCVKGYDYMSLLSFPGYEIVTNNVNFGIKGEYFVTYTDQQSNLYKKKVTVIDESDVLNNTYYDLNYINLGMGVNDSILVDSVYVNDAFYLLEYQQIGEEFNYCLSITKDNVIKSSVIIKEHMAGKPVKLLLKDESIIVLGHTYQSMFGSDIYLGKFNLQGQLITETTIGGSGVDIAVGMDIVNDYIYLYGSTTSNNSYFKGVRKVEDAFIMRLNTDNLYPLVTKVFTKEYLNQILDLKVIEDEVYAIMQYVSKENNQNYVKCLVMKMSLDLENSMEKDIVNSYTLSEVKLRRINNGLYMLGYQFDYGLNTYSSIVCKINANMDLELIDKYLDSDLEHFIIKDFRIDNNKMVYLYEINGTNPGSYLVVKENNKMILSLKLNDELLVASTLVSDHYAFLSTNKYLVNYNYISMLSSNTLIINEVNKKYTNNHVIINNQEANLVNLQETILPKSSSGDYLYGDYLFNYQYETDEIIFCYHQNIHVDSILSIQNEGVYDKNLRLDFNGEGYLNDKKIESGYVINEIGEYTFELVGSNVIKKTYNFTIQDLSYEITSPDKTVEVKNIDYQMPNPHLHEILTVANIDVSGSKGSSNYWLILIPLALLIGGLIMVKVKKR